MNTTLIEQPEPEQQTIMITVTKQTIHDTIDGLMGLKIKDIGDTAGRELVATARKQVVKLRTTAEAERVQVKEQALEECRRIDASWKELFALIEPVETHLKAEEKKIKDIELQIEREKLDKLIESRIESLARVGVESIMVNTSHVGSMTDDQFTEYRMRLAQQVSEQREAAKKLAAEREELEKAQALQRAERIEAERVRREQQAEIDRQQSELTKQREALAKQQREIDESELAKKQLESNQKLERERLAKLELLKPDHEKLVSVIDQLVLVSVPNVSPDASYAKTQIENALSVCYETIGKVLQGMVK